MKHYFSKVVLLPARKISSEMDWKGKDFCSEHLSHSRFVGIIGFFRHQKQTVWKMMEVLKQEWGMKMSK